jgi:hypothetical protein
MRASVVKSVGLATLRGIHLLFCANRTATEVD